MMSFFQHSSSLAFVPGATARFRSLYLDDSELETKYSSSPPAQLHSRLVRLEISPALDRSQLSYGLCRHVEAVVSYSDASRADAIIPFSLIISVCPRLALGDRPHRFEVFAALTESTLGLGTILLPQLQETIAACLIAAQPSPLPPHRIETARLMSCIEEALFRNAMSIGSVISEAFILCASAALPSWRNRTKRSRDVFSLSNPFLINEATNFGLRIVAALLEGLAGETHSDYPRNVAVSVGRLRYVNDKTRSAADLSALDHAFRVLGRDNFSLWIQDGRVYSEVVRSDEPAPFTSPLR